MFNMGNLGDMLKNAGRIREAVEQATESLGQVQVEGSAGGGVVTARVNGRMELLGVRIDPKLLVDGDAELLEDLVTAAVNQAMAKARDEAAASLQSMAGGVNLPGLGGLFGAGGRP